MKNIFTITFFEILLQISICNAIDTPANLKAEVINQSQVKLSWTGSINDYSYDVRIKEMNSSVWNEFVVLAPSTNRRVNNLNSNTEYEWQVRCTNKSKKEIAAYINGNNFVTFSSCKAPEEITMVRSGIDYLIINWDDQDAEKYQIRIREEKTMEWVTYFIEKNAIRIDKLLPYTEYEVSISAYCNKEDIAGSVFSSSEIFDTHSFLQNDYERVIFENNYFSNSKNQGLVSDAKLINSLGQIVNDIKPACSDLNGVYFDINTDTPAGIYVLQIPGSNGRRYLIE